MSSSAAPVAVASERDGDGAVARETMMIATAEDAQRIDGDGGGKKNRKRRNRRNRKLDTQEERGDDAESDQTTLITPEDEQKRYVSYIASSCFLVFRAVKKALKS